MNEGKSRNIVLIGFMGCGKSTVGIRLSWKHKMPVVDTDKLIEQNAGMRISEIFETKGEGAFRDMETDTLQKLSKQRVTRIISTGGGTPVREENRQLLKECGTVVYLRISPECVYERLKDDTVRPLLQCENPLARIRELMADRKAAYEACAHIIVDVDGLTMEQVLEQIERQVKDYETFGD